jgi:hypothetical protein
MIANTSDLVSRGKSIGLELNQLSSNMALYNLAKFAVDNDLYDALDYMEREGRRTGLSYKLIYQSAHSKWTGWANEAERVLFQAKGMRSELSRFRKLRDQINREYAKQSINLSPIIAMIDEQVSIVEDSSSLAPELLPQTPRRKVKPKSWIHRAVDKIEKNPYYRLAAIAAIILGLIALFFKFP